MNFDVIIIGAGPAGSYCASILCQQGFKVIIVEKSLFPRYSLGESLLPQNVTFLKKANLYSVLEEGDYQLKDGAQFLSGDVWQNINFSDKSSLGPCTTHQVVRSTYDDEIIKKVQQQGCEVLFGHEVKKIILKNDKASHPVYIEALNLKNKSLTSLQGKFLVDASGLAKVLAKKLNFSTVVNSSNRASVFSQIQTKIPGSFDHNKILITVDKKLKKNWFWLIPQKKGLYSFGYIFEDGELNTKTSPRIILLDALEQNPYLKNVIGDFDFHMEPQRIKNYSSSTSTKYGENFICIGNSGEFLDPIFSSGVTVALKSADLASELIIKKLKDASILIDWEKEYLAPLNKGIETFKAFVESWYEGDLQKIIFSKMDRREIKGKIISILAGYAWDESNPYTEKTAKRLKTLVKLC